LATGCRSGADEHLACIDERRRLAWRDRRWPLAGADHTRYVELTRRLKLVQRHGHDGYPDEGDGCARALGGGRG
jgi:hypothetical protein